MDHAIAVATREHPPTSNPDHDAMTSPVCPQPFGLAASYCSAGHAAIIIGKDGRKADAVLAPN